MAGSRQPVPAPPTEPRWRQGIAFFLFIFVGMAAFTIVVFREPAGDAFATSFLAALLMVGLNWFQRRRGKSLFF
jgi:hypothetical protein